MSEVESPKYLVRDPQGNVYGPADIATLRDWLGQGRIVAGMHIAPRETREWVEVAQHPALADLFGGPVVATAEVVTPTVATPVPTEVSATRTTSGPANMGQPLAYDTPTAQRHGLSRAAMIVGIIAPCIQLVGCLCCVGLPFGTLAGLASIVMGIISLSQLRDKPELAASRREAWIGIGLGILALFILLVWAAVMMWVQFRQPVMAPRP